MAIKEQNQTGQEKDDLAAGAKVSVFVNGKRQEEHVLERQRDKIILCPPPGSREHLTYGQEACLVQTLADQRMLFVMLRYEERKGGGKERQELFRLVPGTQTYIWPELHRLAMYAWSPIRVFAPYYADRALLEGEAFLFSLSETEASLMVNRPLPPGAFAECTLGIGGEAVTARAVLTRCDNLDGGACYRAHFTFIDQTLRPRLRDYLLHERAMRMQAVGAP